MCGTILPTTLPKSLRNLSKKFMSNSKQRRRPNGDGWVYKDGESWRFKFPINVDAKSGKLRYKGGRAKTKTEALEKLRKLSAECNTGRLIGVSKGTLEHYLENWLATRIKANRAPATYIQYRQMCTLHIIPHLGKKRVEEVRRFDIQTLINTKKLQSKTTSRNPSKTDSQAVLSRNTLRLIKAVLHSAYNDAIRDGIVTVNPATHIELPRQIKALPISLTKDETRRLLEFAEKSELAELWNFMFITGARLSEALGVRWKDFDLARKRVQIAGQLARKDRSLVYAAGTKTNQIRTIQLPDRLVAQLEELKKKQLISELRDPDEIVFLNCYGRRLDQKYVNTRLKELCSEAKIRAISPHKIRHTMATLLMSEIGDIHTVQKILGHSQIALTANLYAHGTDEAQRRAVNTLEDFLKKT
jgi:integrase